MDPHEVVWQLYVIAAAAALAGVVARLVARRIDAGRAAEAQTTVEVEGTVVAIEEETDEDGPMELPTFEFELHGRTLRAPADCRFAPGRFAVGQRERFRVDPSNPAHALVAARVIAQAMAGLPRQSRLSTQLFFTAGVTLLGAVALTVVQLVQR